MTHAWNVSLHGKNIDKVFSSDTSADAVKRSLVNHDGYDPGIVVTKERKRKAAGKKAARKSPGSKSGKALAAVKEICAIMYPGGDMDAEWSSDELPEIARVLHRHGFAK
jgi:hypothetical protein